MQHAWKRYAYRILMRNPEAKYRKKERKKGHWEDLDIVGRIFICMLKRMG